MSKPASDGGMGCSELDWETNDDNYVRQCKEMANEELPDDMNVAVVVAQDKAAILSYARKAPKRRAFPAWRILAEALLLISDRQCNIETPDTTTEKYLKTQARSQVAHNTATRQKNEVRMSVEQEAEMLEIQEEESQEAFDGSEEDVFGHGSRGIENVAREEQERIQPPTKLQTLERMTKRLGQMMMEKMGWTLDTAPWFKSRTRPPLRCKRIHGEWNNRQERELGQRHGTWSLHVGRGAAKNQAT